MQKLLLLIALLLSISFTVKADEASHKELVEQLFTVTNMKEGFDNTCKEVIDMQAKSNPMMEPFRGVLTEFFTKYISWEALKPDITKLYMDTFTEDELRDIVGFLSSPVGIMYTEKSFEMTLKSMEIGQKMVQENMPELQAMIAAEAEKLLAQEREKKPADQTVETPATTK